MRGAVQASGGTGSGRTLCADLAGGEHAFGALRHSGPVASGTGRAARYSAFWPSAQGGGSIPFEAARLGCDVYASDMNPIACMLTWGALNIIGVSPECRAEIEWAQQAVAGKVDRIITRLRIEHDSQGNRAKAYLYCLETLCPETGWMAPMAPSWVISKNRHVAAQLAPDHAGKRFEIAIKSDASAAEMQAAERGTMQDGHLVYELGWSRSLHRSTQVVNRADRAGR